MFENTSREISDHWNNKNKVYSFRYFLSDKNIEVCQKTFLNTLGLKYNSKINNLYKRVKIEEKFRQITK
jgi:hypothetical protein